MRKFVLIATVALVLVWGNLAYLAYMRSLRQMAIMQGQAYLRAASRHYAEQGFVRNYGTFTVFVATNTVSVGATQYQYFITVRLGTFAGEGTLAMTTNEAFLWIDNQQHAKTIDKTYRPRFFPPKF
jgi:urocanate hydratase